MTACPTCGYIPTKWRKRTTGPFATREELREAVHARLMDGMTGKDIAAELGISGSTVTRIKWGDRPQSEIDHPSGLPKHSTLHQRKPFQK